MSTPTPGDGQSRSLGELISAMTEQLSRLVRAEINLAKAELTERAKEAGAGVGLFAAAAVLAVAGFGTALATAIIALALIVPAWLAALIVTLLLFGTATTLVLVGRSRLSRTTPPSTTVESIKEDVEAVKRGLRP